MKRSQLSPAANDIQRTDNWVSCEGKSQINAC